MLAECLQVPQRRGDIVGRVPKLTTRSLKDARVEEIRKEVDVALGHRLADVDHGFGAAEVKRRRCVYGAKRC